MGRETFPELIGEIDTINTNIKGRLGEFQHLAPLQAELEAWLAEARALESQQEIYTARLRETNEKRRLTDARGVLLRWQTRDALRGHFGPKSQTLREFLVRPHLRRRPPKQEEPPAPPTTPPDTTPNPAPSSTP